MTPEYTRQLGLIATVLFAICVAYFGCMHQLVRIADALEKIARKEPTK